MALTIDVAFALAVSMELLIYGIYFTLFTFALAAMWKRRPLSRASSGASTFFYSTILMFAVATLHIVLALYRFNRAYITKTGPLVGTNYMYDLKSWDGTLSNITICIMTWLGDVLMIYRCYYVWNRNIKVIVIPLLFLFAAIAINIYVIFWFAHPQDPSLDPIASNRLVESIFPMALAKNLLTTGLIIWKIWTQHQNSRAHGIIDRGSRLTLIQVLRIVVESAMIYTLEILVLMILYFRKSSAQFIFQSMVVPSIGIVFALISLRVHHARLDSPAFGTEHGTLPAWLTENNSVIEFTTRNSLPPDLLNFRVSTEPREIVIPGHCSETFDSTSSSQNPTQAHPSDKVKNWV